MVAPLSLCVIGAGPVGLSAALALHAIGLNVTVAEASADNAGTPDHRHLALSPASLSLFGSLQLELDGASIEHLSLGLSDRAAHGVAASEVALEHFGRVIAYPQLRHKLLTAVAERGIEVRYSHRLQRVHSQGAQVQLHWADGSDTTASAVIHADGGRAELPLEHSQHHYRFNYGHSAWSFPLHQAEAALGRNQAFERIAERSVLVVLPTAQSHAVVWMAPSEQIWRWQQLEAAQLMQRLGQQLGFALPANSHADSGGCFPLQLSLRRPSALGQQLWLGNSAQSLHPFGAQGLNLGLRDAFGLAQLLSRSPELLSNGQLATRFERQRRGDRIATTLFTHVSPLLLTSPLPSWLKAAGLRSFESPFLRRPLLQRLAFGFGS